MEFLTPEGWNQSFKIAAEKYDNIVVDFQVDKDMDFMYKMYNKNKHEIYKKVLTDKFSIIFPIEIKLDSEKQALNLIKSRLSIHAQKIFNKLESVEAVKENAILFNKEDRIMILEKLKQVEEDKTYIVFAKVSILPEDFLNIGSVVLNRTSCSRLKQHENPEYRIHYWFPSSAPYYLMFSTAILTVFDSKEKAVEAKDNTAMLRNVVSFAFNEDGTTDIGFNRSYFNDEHELFNNSREMTFKIQAEVTKHLGIDKELNQYIHEDIHEITPQINGVDLVCYSGYLISSTSQDVFKRCFDISNLGISRRDFVETMKAIGPKIISYHKYLLKTN